MHKNSTGMEYIQVKSIEHLDELLMQGVTEFSSRIGILSFSREITFSDHPRFDYEVFSYVDGSSDKYTRQELIYYLSPALETGRLYGEK